MKLALLLLILPIGLSAQSRTDSLITRINECVRSARNSITIAHAYTGTMNERAALDLQKSALTDLEIASILCGQLRITINLVYGKETFSHPEGYGYPWAWPKPQ